MRSAHFGSKRARTGAVAVIVAVCLTMLMAVLAIAIDGGNLLDDQRQCQAVADAAAMAGACDLYSNYAANQGVDQSNSARNAALAIAQTNGYLDDANTGADDSNNTGKSIVQVNIPPQYPAPWDNLPHKPYLNLPGYVEVIITYYQPRGFSGLLGSKNLVVKARAVARGAWVKPKIGVLVLNYSGKATLNDQGIGAFNDVGAGPVIVNSSDPAAAYIGGGGVIRAPEYDVTGGDAGKTTSFQNTSGVYDPSIINTGVHPTPDPLAYLPAPGDASGYPIPPAANVPTKGNTVSPMGVNYTDPVTGKFYNNYYLLSPGSYGGASQPRLPNFTNGDLVVFKQASVGNNGIYYLTAGGFNANTADIRMDTATTGGMMFYNAGTGSNDGINIAGGSTSSVSITPLTSGIYSGLALFQARNATEDVQIAGNGAFTIDGTLYASAANLKVSGNGGNSTIGSQYISLDLTITGGANVIIGTGTGAAKTRILCLVE